MPPNAKNTTMSSWFECKVKYNKIEEGSGKEKSVSEAYLVDAVSFTEAEERIHKQMAEMVSGEFEVTNIRREKLTDLFHIEDSDIWYKCKVVYIDADESSGKEKKSSHLMLVTANSFRAALENLEKSMKDILIPWEIKSITESPIVEIFPYFDGKDDYKGTIE